MQSMTGYGRCEKTIEDMDISVEIKSVNHRFADYNIRVPRFYGFLEDKVRKYLQNHISRGKIDVYISIINKNDDSRQVSLNSALAGGYVNALKEIAKTYNLTDDISVSTLARFGDIFEVEYKEQDEQILFERVKVVLDEAIQNFIQMRVREGEKLKEDILNRKELIKDYLKKVEELAPGSVENYKIKLDERIKELIGDIKADESRILTEIAIFADRICITEEIVRLSSHLSEFERIVATGEEAVGRKLDFLLQEMNREVNTMGSKSNDLEISKCVVSMKTELEKIREQIQNIE